MQRTRRSFRDLWLYPVIGVALIFASACNSSPASSRTREAGATGASNDTGTHIDVMRIGDRINNPPEAFHYSYAYTDESSSVDKEADVTAQAVDITCPPFFSRIVPTTRNAGDPKVVSAKAANHQAMPVGTI